MLTRIVDVAVALALGLILLPLALLLAFAVKLDSRGPALYSQLRVGRGGRLFRLHKLRTMVVDADRRGPPLTLEGDERITRVGRVLRPLGLDELPQLFNVVAGDMCLVGPRPELPSIVARYSRREREVLSVRPGLVGPTSLRWRGESALYPDGADPVEYYVTHILPSKLRSDREYLEARTLLTDLACLVRVPLALIRHALLPRRPLGGS